MAGIEVIPIFREVPAPTTAIAELVFDLPVLGPNTIWTIERIIHIAEQQPVTFTAPAAADADIDEVARSRYALSLDQGLAAVPTGYRRNRTLWYQNLVVLVQKSAAGGGVPVWQNIQGMPQVYVPFPKGIRIADARLSLYSILEGDNTPVGSVSVLELLVSARKGTTDVIMTIARSGEGFV